MTNQLNRRDWLQSTVSLVCASLFHGCGRREADGGNQLKVFNWSDYIHERVIPDFESQTGCSVVYDNYSSDAELEARLATGAGSYDVVFPSDRAMAALVAKGLLSDLDRSRLTNFRHLDPKFLGPPFDPENRYSVPYFWGTLAVGVRSDFVTKTVQGMEVLFDALYRGRITMLDDMENVVAAVLGHLRLPLNSVEPEHLAQAQRLLLAQKPLVQAYTSDSYRERLIAGDAWASLGWSGDLLQADAELEASDRSGARVRVIIPPSGTLVWMDSMAIPRAARNVELAHNFLDYLLDPAVAALNAQKVNYATPNVAARALLPAHMLADERIYPPQELLDRCTWLTSRGAKIEKIEQVWRVVRA